MNELRELAGPNAAVYETWRRLGNGQFHHTISRPSGPVLLERYLRSDYTPVGTALVRRAQWSR